MAAAVYTNDLTDPRAGQYWRTLQTDICKSACRVTAGEFTENVSFKNAPGSYMARYIAGTKRAGYVPPKQWSFHPYKSGETRSTAKLSDLLKATRNVKYGTEVRRAPKLWLTEQGGRHFKYRASGLSIADSDASAASDLYYLVHALPPVSDRIVRFYAYQWQGAKGSPSDPNPENRFPWDSGVLDSAGNPRTMYDLYKACINRDPLYPTC